jgi:hypothetical protein
MTTLLIISQSPSHAEQLLTESKLYEGRSVEDDDVIVVTNNEELEALPEFEEKPEIRWIGSPRIDYELYKRKTRDE